MTKLTRREFAIVFKTRKQGDEWICEGTWDGMWLGYVGATEEDAIIEAWVRLVGAEAIEV